MSADRSRFDWVPEALACAIFVAIIGTAIIGTVAVSWSQLSAAVPIHFNAAGDPDRFGPRSGLLIIPVAATLLYVVLTAASANTRLVNIPLTPDRDAPEVQALLLRMVIVLKTVLLVNLWYITGAMLRVAGRGGGLGKLFLPISTAAQFGVPAFGRYFAQRTAFAFSLRPSARPKPASGAHKA